MIAFATDEQLAERLRLVEARLREIGQLALATEVADVARILQPEPAT